MVIVGILKVIGGLAVGLLVLAFLDYVLIAGGSRREIDDDLAEWFREDRRDDGP